MAARRAPPIEPAVFTEDDIFWRETNELCARAAGKWLKETINIQRPIASIKLPEMTALVGCILSTWIVAVAARRNLPSKTEAETQARLLLM